MIEVKTGKERNVFWLSALYMQNFEIVAAFPDLLENTRLIITSYDGPNLTLTEEEKQLGFENRRNYLIAPRGVNPSSIPDGSANEWFFFKGDLPEELKSIKSFAPFCPFHFDYDERISELQSEFWAQFDLLKPEYFLLDTNLLLFATKSGATFNKVLEFVRYNATSKKSS